MRRFAFRPQLAINRKEGVGGKGLPFPSQAPPSPFLELVPFPCARREKKREERREEAVAVGSRDRPSDATAIRPRSASEGEMGSWFPSTATEETLQELVVRGGLPARTDAMEWMVPEVGHVEPAPPPGYIVSFMAFHERGFNVPAHDFPRGLLRRWELELQHLTPNGMLHLAAFVYPCEGWLGIEANWTLFKHFFFIKIQKCSDAEKSPAPIGCAMIQLRPRRKTEFPEIVVPSHNTGWREGWFYLRNDDAHPLPAFTGRTFESSNPLWRETVDGYLKTQVAAVVAKVQALRDAGLTEPRIIAHWLALGVVPLRRRTLRLWEMTEEKAPFEGTATALALLPDEVAWRVEEVTGAPYRASRSADAAPPALPSQAARDWVSRLPLRSYFRVELSQFLLIWSCRRSG